MLDLVEFEMWEHRAHQAPRALFKLPRAGDRQRALALRFPHVFEDEKWKAAVMIAVQMADKEQVETVGRDAILLQRCEQTGTRFEQHASRGRIDQIARLRAAITGKRVAGSEQGYGYMRAIRTAIIRTH